MTPDEQAETQRRRQAALRDALEPLLPFLEDSRVVEIMRNPDGRLWVDKAGHGMFEAEGVRMTDDSTMRMIRLVATQMNAEITTDRPFLAGKLPFWGARLQAQIPPIVDSPVFALRKPAIAVHSLADYVAAGVMTQAQAEALRRAVRKRKNILVGGGTGSGKTTLVNALMQEVAATGDRVLIIEDTPELQCEAPNKVSILVQEPVYTWQRAVMDAMRLRPDRIILGETRDRAALQMLKAWNTGHPGGLATLHADDTRAMLERLCQLMEEEVPQAPRRLVAQTISVCIHIARDPTRLAGRVLTGVDQVVGIDRDGDWLLEPLV